MKRNIFYNILSPVKKLPNFERSVIAQLKCSKTIWTKKEEELF